MNILKYLLSKSYRRKFNYEYTAETYKKLYIEEEQQQNIYKTIFSESMTH